MSAECRENFDLERMEAFEERGGVLHGLSLPSHLGWVSFLRGQGRMARLPQSSDRRAIIVAAKNGRSRDEDIRAGLNNPCGIVDFDATVHL